MPPDFLAIGHVTLDETENGLLPGGSCLYSALLAHRLGLRVSVVTSLGPDFPREIIPSEIELVSTPSRETTTFRHATKREGRALWLRHRANEIGAEAVPAEWRSARIVYLCPVAGEVDPRLTANFSESSVGVGAQGWFRSSGPEIVPIPWRSAAFVLPHTQALFLSQEDVAGLESNEILEHFERVPVGALTLAHEGALLFVNGERYRVPPVPMASVEPTGAGDVFAAAFLIHY
ncbi:MAG TPA: PfkB family carbohydrate kinase, partial [Methylomirabilota bacterium]|nr:PfkB family carbohydrate kinase [Methylomirabilota bacterium]